MCSVVAVAMVGYEGVREDEEEEDVESARGGGTESWIATYCESGTTGTREAR